MRFVTCHPERLSPQAVEQCYMAGFEGMPWPSSNTLVESELVIESSTAESGNLFISWQAGNHGPLVLVTGSLVQREQPYLLEVELARGTVHRLRQYIALGRLESVPVPARVSSLLEQATLLCCQAVTLQNKMQEASDRAVESIEQCLEAIEDLLCWDGGELLKLRLHQPESANMLIGFASPDKLDPATIPENLTGAFNMATLPVPWKNISADGETGELEIPLEYLAWCEERQLTVMAGPIVCCEEKNLPDWFHNQQADFTTLQSRCRSYVRQCTEQLKEHVDLWHAAAGLNRMCDLNLSEEQCVRLAIDTVEGIRQQDNQTPVIVSFQQPFGEYLSSSRQDLSPIHFADALVRADLGINGIGLEINWQHGAGNTQPRDLVALANELDRWTLLNMPLVIFLTAPTGSRTEDHPGCSANRVDQLLRVILGRPSVQVVVWNQLRDATEDPRGESGVLDCDGMKKPVFDVIDRLYQQLKSSQAAGEEAR